MDQKLRDRVAEAAERHALRNALEYESEAAVDPILGPLMADHPDFREHGDEVPGVVSEVVERVNDLDSAERRERLADLDPEALAEIDAEEPETDDPDLPDLPGYDDVEQVRLRVAPNPNAPWHLGHARMGAVIGRYAERYDGWFACRFDDTDPDVKRPDLASYDAILDDLAYLGFEPDRVVYASDRVETYYDYARELIEADGAYACTCPQETFSELKNDAEACEHRSRSPAETMEFFEDMIAGEYDSGEIVLRVRTDIEHPNPALRDWVAFRMVDRPHPRDTASEYRCWPMLDFQSAIDDHLLEITHIVRGIDLQDSAKRQGFLYDYFDWEYPAVVHWGRVEVDEYDVPLSASTIQERIQSGELGGWDDPRAPTVASLRRRGIRGEAIVEAMAGLGASTSNVDLAMSSVYAANRDLIDDDADRRFFVRGGLEVPIENVPDTAQPPVHPEHEDRGRREIPVGDSVLLEETDYPAANERVWLKGLACVRREDGAFVGTGDDIDAVREEGVPVVHWVPAGESVPLRLRTMEGDVSGHAEPGVLDHPVDDVVQFERIGFARLDSVAPRDADLVGGQSTESEAPRASEQSSGATPRDEEGAGAETVAYFAHR